MMNGFPLVKFGLVLLGVVAAIGASIYLDVRTMGQISESNLTPEERKKWRRRVLMFRGMGVIQWQQFRRKHGVTSREQHPEDEGLNSAQPPGSD